jgi:hypothetical protein
LKDAKDKSPSYPKELSPATLASMLQKTHPTELDVERLKKLRLMLRNEPAGYVRAGIDLDVAR